MWMHIDAMGTAKTMCTLPSTLCPMVSEGLPFHRWSCKNKLFYKILFSLYPAAYSSVFLLFFSFRIRLVLYLLLKAKVIVASWEDDIIQASIPQVVILLVQIKQTNPPRPNQADQLLPLPSERLYLSCQPSYLNYFVFMNIVMHAIIMWVGLTSIRS